MFWEGPDATVATMLPVPSGPFSPSGAANSINDKGQIVGFVVGQIGDVTTYLPAFWAGPEAIAPTILPVPPGPYSPSGFAGSIKSIRRARSSARPVPYPPSGRAPTRPPPRSFPSPPGLSHHKVVPGALTRRARLSAMSLAKSAT